MLDGQSAARVPEGTENMCVLVNLEIAMCLLTSCLYQLKRRRAGWLVFYELCV